MSWQADKCAIMMWSKYREAARCVVIYAWTTFRSVGATDHCHSGDLSRRITSSGSSCQVVHHQSLPSCVTRTGLTFGDSSSVRGSSGSTCSEGQRLNVKATLVGHSYRPLSVRKMVDGSIAVNDGPACKRSDTTHAQRGKD